jgi:NADH-quinone oxidoreductase subunit L
MLVIAVLAPGLGALIAGLFGRLIGDAAARLVTIALMVVATIAALFALHGVLGSARSHHDIPLADWIHAGAFSCDWTLKADALSASMVAMVTFVSTLVHLYSVGYMSHEERPVFRFFAYLSLFTFAMLMLVTADNLIQLFFGWEGVGLMSYLLIGYWYDRPSANAAAIKAFIFNRVADLFFMVGIALTFLVFGSVELDRIFANVAAHAGDTYHVLGLPLPALDVIGVLLFVGAMGKSAQLFFQPWLADAMEGPTPVSALIHAATMVTAGVFLVARFSPLLVHAPAALSMVAFIGGTTAFFAATIGLVQTDIKRVIAWSTCSQLGYMFLGCGVGAFDAGLFHLFTHAFFKALLFLAAGSVIHALSGEQDLFCMGGLWRRLPITYGAMWCGGLALAGIPPFAGFWSKDAILDASFNAPGWVAAYGWFLGVVTVALTAFYTFRMIFLAFHGRSRVEASLHPHESPPAMLLPLLLLSLGAVFAGLLLHGALVGNGARGFWHGVIVLSAQRDRAPSLVSFLPTLLAFGGVAVAGWFYLAAPAIPGRLSARLPALHRFLLECWYFDALYDRIFVRPYRALAALLWRVGDRGVIDAASAGITGAALGGSGALVRIQTGSIAVYAFTMLIGLVVLLTTFLVAGSGL